MLANYRQRAVNAIGRSNSTKMPGFLMMTTNIKTNQSPKTRTHTKNFIEYLAQRDIHITQRSNFPNSCCYVNQAPSWFERIKWILHSVLFGNPTSQLPIDSLWHHTERKNDYMASYERV